MKVEVRAALFDKPRLAAKLASPPDCKFPSSPTLRRKLPDCGRIMRMHTAVQALSAPMRVWLYNRALRAKQLSAF